MKRIVAIILSCAMVFSITTYADEIELEEILENNPEIEFVISEELENANSITNGTEVNINAVQYPDGVTDEMANAAYWNDKSVEQDVNKVIMTREQIADYNHRAIVSEGTNMVDLKTIETFNADSTKASLKNAIMEAFSAKAHVFANFVEIEKDTYFGNLRDALDTTGYDGGVTPVQYAVAIKRTDIRNIPSSDYIGYSATDSDDEAVLSVLNVNEPFVVKQKCQSDGELFYYGNSNCVAGWVNAADLAICNDYDEWIDAWEVDSSKKDFVVIIQDKVVLEKSVYAEYSSEIKMAIGTVLKEVAEEDIPRNIAERGPWNNYVVYIPTSDADGKYVKKMALISQNDNISEGFLPFTKANIIDVAMNCLGNRYGWGGTLDAMDCSLYTRSIYSCFGLVMPRNTSWQPKVSGTAFDISSMSDAQKINALKCVPAGALLYFPGHTMMYLGMVDDRPYCISATGSLSDSAGPLDVRSMYSVIITPLDVRRGGTKGTWLKNLTTIVCVQGTAQYNISGEPIPSEPEKKEIPTTALTIISAQNKKIAEDIGAKGKMKYVVSDKGLASVSSKGVLKDKGKGGEVTITGYTFENNMWIATGKLKVTIIKPSLENTIYACVGDEIAIKDYLSGAGDLAIESIESSKSELISIDSNANTLKAIAKGKAKVKVVIGQKTLTTQIVIQ